MNSLITALESRGHGPTLVVKDLIDIEGVITTAGSRAVASIASPARADAPLLAGARSQDVRIIGKANLYELAFGASGVNPHFGTPTNPLDERLLPGGSSSGTAVSVATGEALVGLGSDTGGSIRVPAAFCGITGLKTTHGRISLDGVYPLSPSLDTVGPMATNVAGLVLGMELLEPGFVLGTAATSIGLVRETKVDIDPVIQSSIDDVCRKSECKIMEVELPQWMEAFEVGSTILHGEAVVSNKHLMDDQALFEMLSAEVQDRLLIGTRVTAMALADAFVYRGIWRQQLDAIFSQVEILALPSVGFFPPPLGEAFDHTYTHLTMPFNLAGYPAVSIPIPSGGPIPASLQLLGPKNSEALLLASAAHIERVVKG